MKRVKLYIEKTAEPFGSKVAEAIYKKANILMVLYGVICVAMHFIRVFDNSFWADEAFAVNAARMSFSDMIWYVADEGHTPFYYVYLWLVRAVFGDSGTMYHMASLVPYILIVVVTLTLVRKLFGNGPALILLTCAAFLDSAVTYNLEVRMYAWCEFFILMAFLFSYRIYKSDCKLSYILMSLVSIGAVYGHYFSLGTIGLLYAGLFIYMILKRKGSIWKVFVSGVAVLVAFAPWVIYCQTTQGNVMRDYDMQAATWRESLEFVFHSRFSFILLLLFFVFLAVFLAYETGLLVIDEDDSEIGIHLKNNPSLPKDSYDLIWVIGGFIAVFGTLFVAKAISSLIYPILNLRYIYISYVIIWLIFGVAIARCRAKNLFTGVICIFIVLTCIPNYISVARLERECNIRLANTLAITAEIDSDYMLTTNNVHFNWTVGEAYYPNTPIQLFIGAEIPVFDKNKNNILVLDCIMTQEIMDALALQGLGAEPFVDEGYLGLGNVWMYRVVQL